MILEPSPGSHVLHLALGPLGALGGLAAQLGAAEGGRGRGGGLLLDLRGRADLGGRTHHGGAASAREISGKLVENHGKTMENHGKKMKTGGIFMDFWAFPRRFLTFS